MSWAYHVAQGFDLRKGLARQGRVGHRADAYGGGIAEIAERFQMVRAVDRISGDLGQCAVHQTVADRVYHGLILANRVDDARELMGAVKAQGG
ncbi:MAG: hypothetical protein AAFR93_02020, partial [Pseudomonadota bacterium]